MANHQTADFSPFAAQCILSALKEVQDTIRAYDTKAQIVGVGFIFSIGIITAFATRFLPLSVDADPVLVVLFWFIAMGPIVMFGAVLYPSRKVAPDLGDKVQDVKFVYYCQTDHIKDLSSYINDLQTTDWATEIGYEMVKLSGLREIKRRRFLRALWAAGISYLVAATTQIVRVI